MSLRVDDFRHAESQSAQSPPPVSPAPSMFAANATFGETRETEFIHSGGNTYYNKFVWNPSTGAQKCPDGAVPDVIETLNSALPPLLEEIRKINSRVNVEETTGIGSSALPQATSEPDAVVDDIVPSDSSSLPMHTSIAAKYSRTMLKCLAGYPLYKPDLYNNSASTTNHLHEGIRIGDVGFIRENGAFDLLFNICPSQRDSSNPPGLPNHFTLQRYENAEIHKEEGFPHTTRLFHLPVHRAKRLFRHTKYICSESDGAILELPEGATKMEVINKLPFKEHAMRCGVEWYQYTMSQGRDITNGSLYLVTSSTMCAHWGIAVVERPCPPGEGLRFVHNKKIFRDRIQKYHWKGSRTFTTTSAQALDPDHGIALNQCVFLRGFKIRLRGDIWCDLINERRRLKPQLETSSDLKLAPVYPSDLINVAVLSQQPGAEIAITHDDEWCDLLRDIFMSPKPLDFSRLALSHTSLIDKNGSISFQKSQLNSTLNDVNVHALAKSTRKTLKRLAPFSRLRPVGPVQDAALVKKILVKIKNLIDGINSSMLATQSALTLANEVLQLTELTKFPTDQESSIIPRRVIEGLEKLAGIATSGEKYAQQSGTIFKNFAQDLYEVAAMTKEKRDVMVIVPLDPEQPDLTIKKSLHDVGLDLHANLTLCTNFAQQVSALANWLALVRREISTAASQNTNPDIQLGSSISPGAITATTLPPMLNVGLWTKVQAEYHSYFRTISQVQSHYHNLVSTSFEAWQLSAKSIPLSSPGDGNDSDRSTSPSLPVPTAALPPPNPNQKSPARTRPSVAHYDTRSRPLSTAFEDGPNDRQKEKGFNLRALFTSLSPRPKVKGLFPTSLSTNKRSASGPSEHKSKGKKKERRE